MAAQRLTYSLRDQIATDIVVNTFKMRKEELSKRESAIANKVLDWAIGPENMKLMNQLPAEFFSSRSNITAHSKEDSVLLQMSDSRRVPAILVHRYVELPTTNGMWKEIRAVAAERTTVEKGARELREQAMAMLNSVQTIKRLVEVWPEVEQFLPKVGEQIANLPAVRAEDLNTMIRKYAGQ